jgi:two-component system response regulator YesN
MKNAKKMILENKYKMFEIADLIGYETARYFAATFKKYYGVTPSDYKKRLGGL